MNLKKVVFVGKNGFLLALLSILFACGTGSNPNNSMLFTAAGKTNEILVVTHEPWWDGAIGDTVKASLGEPCEWLIKEEPMFDFIRIPPKNFEGVYQKYRNILIISRNESRNEPKIEIKKNVWSNPQVIVQISLSKPDEFAAFYTKHMLQIKALFYQNEMVRINNTFKSNQAPAIAKRIKEKFGFELAIPKDFILACDTTDFVWIRKQTPDVEEGILIYTFDYTDTNQFSMEHIIVKRNELTKKFIPGPIDTSWMKVSNVFPPYFAATSFKGKYASLLRTWWDLNRYPMGGPLLSYTFLDEKTNKIVVLDGFIYAPKKDKRDLLILLDAIFDTYNKP